MWISGKFFYVAQSAELKTLGQIKRGESIQCIACATKISLKDENGRVAKVTKQVQDVMESLEKTVEKIGGSLKLK
jgi:hypothetical protein